MKEDRTFHLIKYNLSARILRVLDFLWLVLTIALFILASRYNIQQKYVLVLSLSVVSLYNMYFLYSKRINFGVEDWTIPKRWRPQLIKYYIQYHKTPRFELIIWGILLIVSICLLLI